MLISENEIFSNARVVTSSHFGANIVTVYDQEFGQVDGSLANRVAELGAETLRYPGGSCTEYVFDMRDPEKSVSTTNPDLDLLPMSQFFASAGRIGSSAAIVIPTREAFEEATADAMLSGTYGNRTELKNDYLRTVENFVTKALEQGEQNGVDIVAFEIGNEFWGSGEMTASEYGWLAGKVALAIEGILIENGSSPAEILVQTTAWASQIFSPKSDTIVYISDHGDPKKVLNQNQLAAEFQGEMPDGWTTVIVPGQGWAGPQSDAIARGIMKSQGASEAIDGIVQHYYDGSGLEEVDTGSTFLFSQFDRLESSLGRDEGDMSRHITEWNTPALRGSDNRGMAQSSMMIEKMFEMTSQGADAAQIWPLTFNLAQTTSLVDQIEGDLSIAGETFKLMQESLSNLLPFLDEETNDFDVHGYKNDHRFVFFLGERRGEAREAVEIDFSDVVPIGSAFVTFTAISDGGAGGYSSMAEPIISIYDGLIYDEMKYIYDFPSWSNARIEVTFVTNGADFVVGRSGNDYIEGKSGSDTLQGGRGDDYLDGDRGRDYLVGGAGDDTLVGGLGRDSLIGSDGFDTYQFWFGDGHDIIDGFEIGVDRIVVQNENLRLFQALSSGLIDISDKQFFLNYGEGDTIRIRLSDGHDNVHVHYAVLGHDRITGGKSLDLMFGSEDQDDLRGGHGADYLTDGFGVDALAGGRGADYFYLSNDNTMDRIRDFDPFEDIIDLSAWGVTSFDSLYFEVDNGANGVWKGRTFLSYEGEVLRLDGFNEEMVESLNADSFIFA